MLWGMGTVGFGVYQRLLANPDAFEVVGCLVRDRAKYLELQVPDALLHSDKKRMIDLRPDVIIDALPGVEPSRDLIQQALRAGISVVSANKAVIAEHGEPLATLAKDTRATLMYSAAVGGATPMIEIVDRALAEGSIASIAAVLNGTCNFVLDACAEGAALATATAGANREGFAEADASEDLEGRDAERKLRILCRHAWNADPDRVDVQVLDETVGRRAREAAVLEQRLRQIARATRHGDRVHAQVRFESVEADSFFGRLSREWNAIEVTDNAGNVHGFAGRGAGRWPTTEAVMSDLFDLHRLRANIPNR